MKKSLIILGLLSFLIFLPFMIVDIYRNVNNINNLSEYYSLKNKTIIGHTFIDSTIVEDDDRYIIYLSDTSIVAK